MLMMIDNAGGVQDGEVWGCEQGQGRGQAGKGGYCRAVVSGNDAEYRCEKSLGQSPTLQCSQLTQILSRGYPESIDVMSSKPVQSDVP